MKKCPYCAEKIRGEAIVCRFCGRDIPKPTDDKNQTEKLNMNLKTSQKNTKSILTWVFVISLFITSGSLLYFLIDTQYKLDYATGQYDRSLEKIESLLKERAALRNSARAVRVSLENNFCRGIYVFADSRVVAYARASNNTLFYLPLGLHTIQFCTDYDRSNCGSEFRETLDTNTFTLQVRECD